MRVNDQIISRSDVERAEAAAAAGEPADGRKRRRRPRSRQKNLLRDMIDKQLLLSRGKELGINADAEVIRRLDEIRKQNNLDTMEDLEKAARQQGVSFEDFKARYSRQRDHAAGGAGRGGPPSADDAGAGTGVLRRA